MSYGQAEFNHQTIDAAMRRLDAARSKLADAQSEFIAAERALNNATRSWARQYLGEPQDRKQR